MTDIASHFRKPRIHWLKLHDLLVYGREVKPPSDFEVRNSKSASLFAKELYASRKAFIHEQVKPFFGLSEASRGSVWAADDSMLEPLPFIKFLLEHGYQIAEAATAAYESVIQQQLESKPNTKADKAKTGDDGLVASQSKDSYLRVITGLILELNRLESDKFPVPWAGGKNLRLEDVKSAIRKAKIGELSDKTISKILKECAAFHQGNKQS